MTPDYLWHSVKNLVMHIFFSKNKALDFLQYEKWPWKLKFRKMSSPFVKMSLIFFYTKVAWNESRIPCVVKHEAILFSPFERNVKSLEFESCSLCCRKVRFIFANKSWPTKGHKGFTQYFFFNYNLVHVIYTILKSKTAWKNCFPSKNCSNSKATRD